MKVPFLDLKSSFTVTEPFIRKSLKLLHSRCDFILGKNVADFEHSFANYIGTAFAVGVNSGTDALHLGLLSLGVGPGDEIIVPTFTYIASAFAVTYTGAKPVFCDINDTSFNIDAKHLKKLLTKRTKAIMPVHLYGQAADMRPILKFAHDNGLKVIEDAAQAHGAEYFDRNRWKKAGSMGDLGCFSFYPTKNLGASGDAGLVVTNNKKLYKKIMKLRDYGRLSRYVHDSLGFNSRLDSMQALFLKERLKYLDSWNKKRAQVAGMYNNFLSGIVGVRLPVEPDYSKHVYHIYAIRLKNRDKVLKGLNSSGIVAAVHYPLSLHLQPVYKKLGYRRGDCPVAEEICREVLCLPIHPFITEKQVKYIARVLRKLTQ